MALVEREIKDGIGILTLNNPEKRNSLSTELIDGIIEGLSVFRDEKVPVVILCAAEGGKVWSAGHDIRELPRSHRDPLGFDDPMERVLRAPLSPDQFEQIQGLCRRVYDSHDYEEGIISFL